MSPTQDVIEALQTQLTGSTPSLAAKGITKFYHQLAKQNDPLPYIIHDLLDVRMARAFDGKISYEWDVHFDIFVDRSIGTAAATGGGSIAQALFDDLDEVEMTVVGLDRGLVLFNRPGGRTIEEDAIRVSSDARIFGTTT